LAKRTEAFKSEKRIIVLKKHANFFRRKLAKISENSDHNFDPKLSKSPLYVGKSLSLTFVRKTSFTMRPFYFALFKPKYVGLRITVKI
jgi:hypothetical protein